MHDAILLKRLLLPAALALGSACSAPDRPAPSDPIVSSTGVTTTREPGSPACEALSYRECTLTYVDEDGQLQCPAQVQICNAQGTAWLACGQYVFDEDGQPRARESR